MMAQRHAESAREENFGGLLHQFHPDIKKMARQLERIEQKLVRQESSVEFNTTYKYTVLMSQPTRIFMHTRMTTYAHVQAKKQKTKTKTHSRKHATREYSYKKKNTIIFKTIKIS